MPASSAKRNRLNLVFTLVLAAAACGGSDEQGPDETLEVLPRTQEIADCQSGQVTAVRYDANGDPLAGAAVSFASTDPGVGTVDNDGTITANGVGIAGVIVTSGNLRDTVVFEVKTAPRIVAISVDSLALFKGQTRRVTVGYTTCHGAPAFGPLTYGSDNGAIASFNAGLISALGAGVTSLTVSDGVSSDFLNITVLPFPSIPTVLPVSANPYGIAVSASRVLVTRLSGAALADAAIPPVTFDETPFAVGDSPADVVVMPAGDKAFVTNLGANTVSVIDVAARTEVSTITLTGNPYRLLLDVSGSNLFVLTNQGTLYRINPVSDAVLDSVDVLPLVGGMALSPDEARLYVTHAAPSQPTVVVDLESFTVLRTIPALSGTLQDVAVSPDGGTLYVANEFNSGIKVWNLATDQLVTTLPFPDVFAVKLSPGGGDLIYAAGGGQVNVYERSTFNPMLSLSPGGLMRRIAISQDGSVVFVTNYAGSVLVIQ